jgi:hypothetical protein
MHVRFMECCERHVSNVWRILQAGVVACCLAFIVLLSRFSLRAAREVAFGRMYIIGL